MMKKTLLLMLLAAVVCIISVAAYTERVYQPAEGFRAPQFSAETLEPRKSALSLSDHRGRYVLLSFWSSADPSSRMRNMNYDALVHRIDDHGTNAPSRLAFISVNFDTSPALARQIARRDSLELSELANVQGPAARKLIADYRLADGYRAYLIDPAGRVVATNPSPKTLDTKINQ